MAELKTKPTKVSVAGYLAAIENDARRQDCEAVVKMMTRVTKEKPVMWGPSIIGFGKYHYKYDSGHEGDMCIAGFASRKDAIVIYLMPDILADQKRMLGADHPDTLAVRMGLALAYQRAGRTAEAVLLFEQTLADRERVLGADHPETLRTRNSLAIACQETYP